MEKVKQELRQLKETLQNRHFSEKTQELLSQLETEIDQICKDPTLENADEIEYTLFIDLFKTLSTKEEFVRNINPQKARDILSAALPYCYCEGNTHCVGRQKTEELVDAFVNKLLRIQDATQ